MATDHGVLAKDELLEALATLAYENHQYANIGYALRKHGWPLIVEFVAAWMQDWYETPEGEFRMPRDWRKEMLNGNRPG